MTIRKHSRVGMALLGSGMLLTLCGTDGAPVEPVNAQSVVEGIGDGAQKEAPPTADMKGNFAAPSEGDVVNPGATPADATEDFAGGMKAFVKGQGAFAARPGQAPRAPPKDPPSSWTADAYDTPIDAPAFRPADTNYLCDTAGLSLPAVVIELDAKTKRLKKQTAVLAEENAKLDALRAVIKEETARLESAVRAFDEMKTEEERLAEIAKAKGIPPPGSDEAVAMGAGGKSDPTSGKSKKVRDEYEAKLAKSMEAMNPKSAADLLLSLEGKISARILRRMKPKAAGAVLAVMTPADAAVIATQTTREPE